MTLSQNPVLTIYLVIALVTFAAKLIQLAYLPRYMRVLVAGGDPPPVLLAALVAGLLWPILVVQKIIL